MRDANRHRLMPLAAVVILMSTTPRASCHEPQLKGRIPNHNEALAIAKGVQLRIGSANLIGPQQVEVFTSQTWPAQQKRAHGQCHELVARI